MNDLSPLPFFLMSLAKCLYFYLFKETAFSFTDLCYCFVSTSFISIMIFMISSLLLISVKGNYWNILVISLVILCIMFLLLFSHPVVSNSLGPHRLQHVRPLYPLSPRVFPSSCPLHWWCHPAISSSDTVFSFCPQSFPVSGTFLVSQLFTSGDQNTGASASASVFPMNIQGWFPLRLTGLISLLSKGLSRVFFSSTVWRPQFFGVLPSS